MGIPVGQRCAFARPTVWVPQESSKSHFFMFAFAIKSRKVYRNRPGFSAESVIFLQLARSTARMDAIEGRKNGLGGIAGQNC